MGHAGLIVKATRLCNLRCTYCHDWASGPGQTMRFPVLARMIQTALQATDHDSVDFIWHGGEPTVLPLDFYRKALYVESTFARPGQRVRNILQTNGTALTPEWARFLHTYEFGVGVSLDGPPEINDRYRRYATGRPSSDDVVGGIRLLQDHGVRFSVLMVVDEATLGIGPDRVFDYFLELGCEQFSLLSAKPVNQPDAPPGTRIEHYVDPTRITAFLTRMYDRWVEHGDERIQIRELAGIENRLRGLAPGLCTLAGNCLGKYYVVEANGDVAHCDLFVDDSRYTLGNVMTQDFAGMRSSLNLKVLKAGYADALAAMRSCPEFGVCQGWCPHERYLSVRHNPHHADGCCGLRHLIGHVRDRIDDACRAAAVG